MILLIKGSHLAGILVDSVACKKCPRDTIRLLIQSPRTLSGKRIVSPPGILSPFQKFKIGAITVSFYLFWWKYERNFQVQAISSFYKKTFLTHFSKTPSVKDLTRKQLASVSIFETAYQ